MPWISSWHVEPEDWQYDIFLEGNLKTMFEITRLRDRVAAWLDEKIG